ncbi:MAG TPA: urea ABC transporter ATP-binding subunit UrtE [Candidatus Hydrogenedentes bacterium]|nr:urea ABC transporter ATP-binding subunit UrtE [Candidatus Hydrogenedentota bacterium]HIB54779.1 urea ABC transporter ATP-binding subunit UrtE [Nitrospirales bacterium]
MLTVRNLSFAYGEIQTLNGVNISIDRGEMVSVIGRNGVGKTTLVRNILGLENAASGTVSLNGEDISSRPAHYRAIKGMGYVPQGRMIFPKLSVEENLGIALAASDKKKQGIPERIYEYFPVLKEMSGRMGGDLSGGQQQQLAIGRALATQPKLLVLDEPTEGIQPNIITQIGEVLHRLIEEEGVTVLIIEQYLDFVRKYCHRFYVMNRGQAVAEGTTENLSEEIVKEFLSV